MPLLRAAEVGNPAQVLLLLETGTDVNSRNECRETPLIVATRNGRQHVARLLLSNGADINASDARGLTALFWAILLKHHDIAQLLLEKGASPDAPGNGYPLPPGVVRRDQLLLMSAEMTLAGGYDEFLSGYRTQLAESLATMVRSRLTGTLRQRETNDPQHVVAMFLQGHTDDVLGVAFSPSGRRLATASCDGSIKLWDPSNWDCVTTIPAQSTHCMSVAFSRDGSLVASCTLLQHPTDPTIAWATAEVWDTITGQCKSHRRCSEDQCISMPFSPTEDLIALPDGPDIILWHPITGKTIKTLHGDPDSRYVSHLTFSPDGRFLASATEDATNAIKIWNIAKGTVIETLPQAGGPGLQVTFPSRANCIAVSKADNMIRYWFLDHRTYSRTYGKTISMPYSSNIIDLAVSPMGLILACSYAGAEGLVRVWNPMKEEVLCELHSPKQIFKMVVSPDGRTIVAGSTKDVIVWRLPERVARGQKL